MFTVDLFFAETLRFFLPRAIRGDCPVRRTLNEKASIKDIIESCGVPHPEVDLILLRDDVSGPRAVDFAWLAESDVTIEVFGVPAPAARLPGAPRLQRPRHDRFLADGHLGKLARNLRLLGIDTAYEREADDHRLLDIMASENRALLTRDRRLLMHSVVETGYCPRSHDAEEQTREVLRRFDFTADVARSTAFRRCLHCNSLLAPIAFDEVRERLAHEPLTLQFYRQFRRCAGCQKIFWAGSHFQKLAARIERLLARRAKTNAKSEIRMTNDETNSKFE